MGQSKPYEHDLDQAYLANILPEGPGVYLFKDSRGKTLYVGKAKNLRKRVLSYFRARGTSCSKTLFMLKKASGLDFILTSNEKEAFILESTLIKRYKPRYNIVLRDDSQYPCLRLSLEEPFPRLTIVRKIKRDGARYFGPFSSASAVRNTLKVIDRIFQLRKCKTSALPKRSRPCLNYQMDRCLAPCSGKISEAEYGRVVRQVILFLEGKSEELISHLAQEMKDASARLEFERAARLRDQITSVQKTIERQQVVSPGMEDLDVIGIAQREDSFQLVVMYIREGRLIGIRNYRVKSPGHSPSEVMEAFIKQYYSRDLFLPGEIILSTPIEEAMAISAWLTDCAAKKVSIKVPKRGTKKRLTEMAVANAESLLSSADLPEPDRLIALIKERLGLTRPPVRIEGLDVSTLYGSKAVGAIVSFVNGKPYKAGYRNFKIKWADGMDDYGMLAEVVARRIALGDLPDLFLVDGGKGQLAVLERVVKEHVGKTSPQLA
ncbi:MAG TPA: excinuclease ABC subunit UvrC, partial [Desulfobacterales bacterium]|nr:excinuclease ABC subunit UvrC [Desulfobacterales bacterium]